MDNLRLTPEEFEVAKNKWRDDTTGYPFLSGFLLDAQIDKVLRELAGSTPVLTDEEWSDITDKVLAERYHTTWQEFVCQWFADERGIRGEQAIIQMVEAVIQAQSLRNAARKVQEAKSND